MKSCLCMCALSSKPVRSRYCLVMLKHAMLVMHGLAQTISKVVTWCSYNSRGVYDTRRSLVSASNGLQSSPWSGRLLCFLFLAPPVQLA